MGVVYVAEQIEPVRRRVALKIIKPGMDTKQVIARFEVERQALAMMDHPNIARVLDAGTTDAGRPYFVMELVRGMPITEYCDKVRLSPRQRLELFIDVCQAVQHAHQKGIIHRDLIRDMQLIQFAQYPAASPTGILSNMGDQFADDSFGPRPISIGPGLHAVSVSLLIVASDLITPDFSREKEDS
jgi:serine/threonine protein kinase